MITKKAIEKGLCDAYKRSRHNAYFGNGFKAGVDFAVKYYEKNSKQVHTENQILYTKDTCPVSDDWLSMGGRCGWKDECFYCEEMKMKPIKTD